MCISVKSWKSSSGPTKPPEIDEPEQVHTWSHGKFTFEIQHFKLIVILVK